MDQYIENLVKRFESDMRNLKVHMNKIREDLQYGQLWQAGHHFRECKTFYRNCVNAYNKITMRYSGRELVLTMKAHLDLAKEDLQHLEINLTSNGVDI